MRAARLAAERLFNLLPPLDVGDAREFIAGTVAILVRYPADVMMQAVDPAVGIPSRCDRPTLRLIKEVCEEFYAPIRREEERTQARAQSARGRELPRPPRTPEQQARIDAQIAGARHDLGIPTDGLSRRGMQPPPPSDGPRSKYLLADLEARRLRNQSRESSNDGEPSGG